MINAVIAAVGTMLVLSLSRVHVVIAIIVGALVGGLTGGLGIDATLKAFNSGLGGGATVALSYALLGAFAVAIAKSGLAHALADKALLLVDRQDATGGSHVKWLLIGLLWVVAIASQNILPIHIAFIPLLVPPLLYVLTKLQLDRRLIACVMTFGLITPYMFLPVGFGNIFLNQILLANVAKSGVDISQVNVTQAMGLPALGMVVGLLVAVFISYRKKRVYDLEKIERVDRFAIAANFKVDTATVTRLSQHCRGVNHGALRHFEHRIVSVGRQQQLIVFDDDQLAVTAQSSAGINHHPSCRRFNGTTRRTG